MPDHPGMKPSYLLVRLYSRWGVLSNGHFRLDGPHVGIVKELLGELGEAKRFRSVEDAARYAETDSLVSGADEYFALELSGATRVLDLRDLNDEQRALRAERRKQITLKDLL